MLLHIYSDLHREFGNEYIPEVEADVVIVCGDIDTNIFRVLKYLRNIASKYENVIYVTGNHEYYGNKIEDFNAMLSAELADSNIHFLNNSSVAINGITFYGGTMWTEVAGDYEGIIPRAINDYKLIPKFSVQKSRELHKKFKDGFPLCADVVVSHHIPNMSLVDCEFVGDTTNGAFACNDMQDYLTMPKLWCYGHTHSYSDRRIGRTRFICNPHGYEPKPRNFNRTLVIEV